MLWENTWKNFQLAAKPKIPVDH